MNARKRVVLIGLGHQARADHLPGVIASQHATLAAVVDVDAQLAATTSEELSVPGYTDAAEALEAEHPDFAIVAVPHHVTPHLIETAAQRGVPVLMEKPFATDIDTARDLHRIISAAGIEVMVSVQRRWNPIYTTVLELLDLIGPPFLFEARYTVHIPDPGAGWRGQRKLAGGGALADMGYHTIDLLMWYLGLPDRVVADTSACAIGDGGYDAEDTALVHLSYDGGPYGSLVASRWAGPKTERLALTGPRGQLIVERGTLTRLAPDGQVIEKLTREQSWPAAATAQIDHFCRVLDGTRDNPSTPAVHLNHAAFLSACYTSAATGLPANPKELL